MLPVPTSYYFLQTGYIMLFAIVLACSLLDWYNTTNY